MAPADGLEPRAQRHQRILQAGRSTTRGESSNQREHIPPYQPSLLQKIVHMYGYLIYLQCHSVARRLEAKILRASNSNLQMTEVHMKYVCLKHFLERYVIFYPPYSLFPVGFKGFLCVYHTVRLFFSIVSPQTHRRRTLTEFSFLHL